MRCRYDSDARTLSARGRVEMAEKRIGRNVEVLRRAHERAVHQISALPVERELGRSVFAGYQRCLKPLLARLDGLAVARDDRIWLSGRNGAGKTTLLKKLLAQMPEEVVHLPPELSAQEARDALDDVRALRHLSDSRTSLAGNRRGLLDRLL